MADIDLIDLVRRGVAVTVATRDEVMRPEIGRAWGPEVSEDGKRLTVCVEAPTGSPMARNLLAGSPAAATITRLASHATLLMLRGPVVAAGPPGPDRLDLVAGHVEAFVAEAAAVGVPEPIARGLVGPDLLCATIELAERLDDELGRGAGRSR